MIGFSLTVVFLLVVLYIPGYWLLKASKLDSLNAFGFAPLYPMFLIPSLGILYSIVDIASNVGTIGAPLVIIPAILFVGRRISDKRLSRTARNESTVTKPQFDRRSFVQASLYIIVGCLVGFYVLVLGLQDLSSPIQSYDTVFHTNLVEHFARSGDWSSLRASAYPLDDPTYEKVSGIRRYYPSAWHLLCAFAVTILNAQVGVVMNAAVYAFAAVVFPVATCVLLVAVFGKTSKIVTCGALCASAFACFPWGLLAVWPLLPNAVSSSMVPLMVAAFIHAVNGGSGRSRRISFILIVFASIVVFAFVQPNSVFTVAVFLAPYCVWLVWSAIKRTSWLKGHQKLKSALALFFPIAAIAALWLILYKMPFMQGTVQYDWDPIQKKTIELYNMAFLNYTGFAYQKTLAVLVGFGVLYCLIKKRGSRWLVFSYAFSLLILFAATTLGDSELKHILAGFWYTDPYRVAGVAVICAIPLAAVGLFAVIRLVDTVAIRIGIESDMDKQVINVFLIALVVLSIYYPIGDNDDPTAFGKLRGSVASWTDPGKSFYNAEERDFVQQVKELIPEDALILNQPFDGSALAYGLDGLNTYYRSIDNYRSGEPAAISSVREAYAAFQDSPLQRQVIEETGAQYVLTLGREESEFGHFPTYQSSDWVEIDTINESTPGVELILENGDMKLYKIAEVG